MEAFVKGKSHAGYISRPIDLSGVFGMDDLSPSERLIASSIRGFARDGKSFDSVYQDLAERYSLSVATVGRTVRKLLEKVFVRKGKSYRFIGKNPEKHEAHVVMYEWLYFAKFELDGRSVSLTRSQIEVLSFIRGYSPSGFRNTRSGIGRILGMSESTACSALKVLEKIGAVTVRYPHGMTATVNGSTTAIFTSNEKLLTRKRAEVVKEKKSREARACDLKSERERFYEGKKQREDSRLKRLFDRLNQDAEYAEADRTVRKLEIDAARAQKERNAKEETRILMQRIEAKKRRENRLIGLGIKAEELERHFDCPICRDSGVRPDHTFCNCWQGG